MRNQKVSAKGLDILYPKGTILYDYIHDFEKLSKFYEYDYRSFLEDFGGFKGWSGERGMGVSRKDLYRILSDSNEKNKDSGKVRRNLEDLLKEGSYTICTGQQCGLLTGPLYTIYKAITAIKIAKDMNERWSGYRFIPVFWIASEDHDFTEVNRIYYSGEGGMRKVILEVESERRALKDVEVGGKIELILKELRDFWKWTEYSDEIFGVLGEDVGSLWGSFRHLMSYLFKEEGLLLIEPDELRGLSVGVSRRVLKEGIRVSELLEGKEVELSRLGYGGSLKVEECDIGLYYFWNGERRKLQWLSGLGEYRIFGTEVYFKREELLEKLEEEPGLFSQNFVLRPIVQDYIFPNVMTVCGGGELNYFARFKGVYEAFGLRMPCLYPRVSVSLMEGKYERMRKRWGFEWEDILNGELDFGDLGGGGGLLVDQFIGKVEFEMEVFGKEVLDRMGVEVLKGLESYFKKLKWELGRMRVQYEKKVEGELGVLRRHIERLRVGLLPRGKGQERVYNIFYYLNLYGEDFWRELKECIDEFDFKNHQVLIDE